MKTIKETDATGASIEYVSADELLLPAQPPRASYTGFTPGLVVKQLTVDDLTDAERAAFGFDLSEAEQA